MIRTLATLSRGIDAVVAAAGRISWFLFVPLTLAIVYDVLQRKAIDIDTAFVDSPFYIPSTLLQELEWHIHGALFLLALGYGYLKDAHVRIELVRDRFPGRVKLWVEMIGICLLLLPYCWFVIEYGWGFAERSLMTNEASASQTGLPYRWIIKAFVPFGFLLLGLAGISVLMKGLVRAGGSRIPLANESALGTAPPGSPPSTPVRDLPPPSPGTRS